MKILRSGYVGGLLMFFACVIAMVAQVRYRIFVGDATLLLSWAGAVLIALALLTFVRDWVEGWFEAEHTIHNVFDKLQLAIWVMLACYALFTLFLFANARVSAPTQALRGTVASVGTSLTFAEDFSRHPWANVRLADGRAVTMLLNRNEEARVWPGLAIELQTKPGALGVTQIVGVARDRESEYQEILKIAPTSTTALEGLMQSYAQRGRSKEALPLAERYLAISSDTRPVWSVGSSLFQRHQLAEASEFMRLAYQKEANRDNTIAYGWVLAKLGKREEALPYLEQGLTIDPVSDVAYYHLAYVQADMGNKEAAIRNFREVLKRRPNYPEVREKIKSLGGEP